MKDLSGKPVRGAIRAQFEEGQIAEPLDENGVLSVDGRVPARANLDAQEEVGLTFMPRNPNPRRKPRARITC
jgi:hypothetical protein